MTQLIPVIISGGAGTRLWPVSRENHPKPFIRLGDGQSLLQKTFLRAARLPGVREVLTVTNREFLFQTDDEYRAVDAGALRSAYVLEPVGRNTAAAIAAAAAETMQRHPDAVLLVLPADHLILDEAAFSSAVMQAEQLARQGLLVTFGIEPDAPETGFGYIQADGHRVVRFTEKPDPATAARMLEQGGFYWNAGMFCFTASTMLDELRQHCPDILDGVQTSLAKAHRADSPHRIQIELDPGAFAQVRDESIDYAVMERSSRVAVVPCNIGWSDIGSWEALSQLLPADADGNRCDGDVVLHHVTDCAIHADQRVVGALGVQGLVIVDTPDALLVAARDRAQDVKKLFATLKRRGNPTYKVHRTVRRPWGTYSVLEDGPHFKIKRIVVKPDASLSLQMHHHRSEHWIVVSGTAQVVNGDTEQFIPTNESTFIPPCTPHRLRNPGIVDLVLIEVQTGQYLGEDDIVRYQDVYGRVQAPAPAAQA